MTKTVKVLIIFREEETLKTIIDLNVEDYDALKCANGYHVNVDVYDDEKNNAVSVIESAFSAFNDDPDYLEDDAPDMAKRFFGTFQNMDCIEDISDVEKIISCGWSY